MVELTITVPGTPVSVNHYVKHTRAGRHYVTNEAKAFKEAVAVLAGGRSVSAQRYEVEIALHLGKGTRIDADNAGKLPLDSLVSAGVIHSDAAVDRLVIDKFRDRENPRTVITVRAR